MNNNNIVELGDNGKLTRAGTPINKDIYYGDWEVVNRPTLPTPPSSREPTPERNNTRPVFLPYCRMLEQRVKELEKENQMLRKQVEKKTGTKVAKTKKNDGFFSRLFGRESVPDTKQSKPVIEPKTPVQLTINKFFDDMPEHIKKSFYYSSLMELIPNLSSSSDVSQVYSKLAAWKVETFSNYQKGSDPNLDDIYDYITQFLSSRKTSNTRVGGKRTRKQRKKKVKRLKSKKSN